MPANAAQFQVAIGILGTSCNYIAALYGGAFRDDHHGITAGAGAGAGVAVAVRHDQISQTFHVHGHLRNQRSVRICQIAGDQSGLAAVTAK